MYKIKKNKKSRPLSIFLSVVGAYDVRTASLNDKHGCQLQNSCIILQSHSSFFFCLHGQAKLFASDHLLQSYASLQLIVITLLQSFESWLGAVSRGFLFSLFCVLSSAFLSSVLQSLKLCLL